MHSPVRLSADLTLPDMETLRRPATTRRRWLRRPQVPTPPPPPPQCSVCRVSESFAFLTLMFLVLRPGFYSCHPVMSRRTSCRHLGRGTSPSFPLAFLTFFLTFLAGGSSLNRLPGWQRMQQWSARFRNAVHAVRFCYRTPAALDHKASARARCARMTLTPISPNSCWVHPAHAERAPSDEVLLRA